MPKTIHQKYKNPALKHWCQKHQLNFCILFGSSVNGPVHAHSDIDIAIESSLDLAPQKLVLIGELQDILDGEIDLVIFHRDMPPLLLYEIMVKGVPLFIANKNIYLEKQIYAIKFYDDVAFLKKWQDLSLKTNLERLKNVTHNYKRKS